MNKRVIRDFAAEIRRLAFRASAYCKRHPESATEWAVVAARLAIAHNLVKDMATSRPKLKKG